MGQWTIGKAAITSIEELSFTSPAAGFVPGLEDSQLEPLSEWMAPYMTPDKTGLVMSVQALGVEVDGHRIIVDTCVGNGKDFGEITPFFNNLQNDFTGRLAAAGFARESVDVVVCTHLHMDHVGWNTLFEDGRWVPTFPNARYVFSQADIDYWRDHRGEPVGYSYDAAVQPLLDAGRVDSVGPDHRISESVRLVPTPGHSPGHVSVRISSGGAEGVITGDLVHSPAQLARPEWSSVADVDQGLAAQTRRRFVEEFSGSGVSILGTHFPGNAMGVLERDGDYWRFVA